MNPSHVVYGACTRDCGVESYGDPQGPRKLLDNGDFGLATWEHQSPSPLLRVLQCGEPSPSINGKALPRKNQLLLVTASLSATMRIHPFFSCCKHSSSQSFLSHQPPSLGCSSTQVTIRPPSFLLSTAASIPEAIPTIPQLSQPFLLLSHP
ncbi:hypothetical protein Pyn_02646 [Prunus yedoensis var. nudiflora]|uniref:Uncharacterized protein n=1 Tax=Prunus yedoensis var. nudiflora TaxID=2094558 RepID=A0A314U994_PRUYE|nr:hypothetical protein Pyn_02646 [Prunus yedoensis var. nudiflora]